ncbi:restriction endonuclease subunit S, partial [Mycoplasmopsis arginini]|uniref:restriction endonuclease subunit S n=1 Tax=Mycoplasmopsis arginini TaxID=2094 RepID=UPI0027366C65
MCSIVTFSKGRGLSKDDLSDSGHSCILYGELYTKYLGKIDEIYSKTSVVPSNPKYSKTGDIIMPLSGETPLDISNSAVVPTDGVMLGSDLLVLTPKSGFNSLFLSYYISNCKKIEIAKKACGTSIIHSHKNDIEKLIVNYPSIKEQDDISQIISKLDKRIILINNKISTLKKYKKGMINQLLNNIKFSNKELLSNICKITTGKLDANAMN